jgi:hypothetical protein
MARPKRISERLVALFVLGVVLMFPPLLGVFNQQLRTFGLPLLYLYLFVAWAALILLTAAVVRSIGADDDGAVDQAARAEERGDA